MGVSVSFTKVEVADQHLISQMVWESLPPQEKASAREREFYSREWAALDRKRFRVEPEGYRTEYSLANLGSARASRIRDRSAIQFTLQAPVAEGLAVNVFDRGAGRLFVPGSREPIIGDTATGL